MTEKIRHHIVAEYKSNKITWDELNIEERKLIFSNLWDHLLVKILSDEPKIKT